MKSKIFSSDNLNNIIYIVLLLVIILIICYKSITIHNNIMEQFENNEGVSEGEQENEEDLDEDLDKALEDVLGTIGNNNSDTDNELEKNVII